MAMSEREQVTQKEMWVESEALVRSPGHPFYLRLNGILKERGFDAHISALCEKFYAESGRPSVPPAIYFRMLMVGYFEGWTSERKIAWHCADSISLREFLGYSLVERTPDHSTLSRIRQRIDVETHQEIFGWVLKALAKEDLISGKTVGIDATTLEANAAMRSIVRRETGEKYDEFLTHLAKDSGIETPTREDLAKLDRKRKNKASNDDWQNPHDPDAQITKMKDGRTHLAHKAEHAVDMDSGAVLAVTVQGAAVGDTTSILETFGAAVDNLIGVNNDPATGEHLHSQWGDELVADKGYHSNEILSAMSTLNVRTYVSEPDRGQRQWKDNEEARDAVYANRRRIKGTRGKRLLSLRGEKIERSFAHCYETGGMRRTHLRGHENILKRLLIHVSAFNLSLIFRRLFGFGTPREMVNAMKCAIFSIFAITNAYTAGYQRDGHKTLMEMRLLSAA
jgi:transposase